MPYVKILLAAAIAALACLALAALLKSRRRAGPMLTPPSGLPPMKGSLDANARGRRVDVALGREILEMLETNRRAEAVALVRERTGWGARQADAAVVRLENLWKRLES
ncbi:MAG: hypothetical protein ACJ74Q_13040 [Pyrinomonadaceae bacterium]